MNLHREERNRSICVSVNYQDQVCGVDKGKHESELKIKLLDNY